MNKPPKLIFLFDTIQTVMRKFETNQAWYLPVVENDKYIGFIFKSKLLTVYRNKFIEVCT
ncbi:MAG: CBS domain-containing protein [Flavobacteriales bacterium]